MKSENVDPEEITKFDEAAYRWWDMNSEFKVLHDMNPLRLNYIDERIGLSGKKILDVGCGGGILSESMAQRGAQVKGIDLGKAALSVARLHALESEVKVDYEIISTESLAEREAGEYDAVCCLEMLEHVPDPQAIIHACAKLVKPGGKVFFSTINRNPKSYLMAIVGAEYVLRLLPRGTHEYKKFIKPSELDRWSRDAGLSMSDLRGIEYNPLSQTFSLNNDVDVNYIVSTEKTTRT